MTLRDRLVVSVIVAVAAVGLMWVAVVSPKRSEASSLTTQIATAQASLVSAEQQLVTAHQAQSAYVADVRAVNELTTAAPVTDGAPGLLRLISSLAGGHSVDFKSVTLSTPSAGSSLEQLNLSFSFAANYISLQKFLDAVDGLTVTNGVTVRASGRLLTINSLTLAPSPGHGTQATITATAYVQPPSAPATATGATGATTAGVTP